MTTKFGIEWAYGEFKIGRFHQGTCVESWRSPEPVTDLASLNWAMVQARQHIDMERGGSVAIAYEDDTHTHEFLEVPLLSKRDLDKYLSRRVEQDKLFAEEAAWCHHPANRGVGKDGILLHLMPKNIVDAVVRICEEHYLVPKRLVPLTEVLSEYVPTLEAATNDILLLVAPFASRVELVVSQGNGNILFVRELAYNWRDQLERLVMDINRTAGYCKQRIGGKLSAIWVIGENAGDLSEAIGDRLDVEVNRDQPSQEPSFWMTQVAALPQRLSSNFIPKLARNAVNQKSITRAAVLAGFALTVCSLGVVGGVEIMISSHHIDADEVDADIHRIHEDIHTLEQKIEHAKNYEQTLQNLTADAFNLPALFLSHLGEMVPDGLVLRKASIERTGASWQVNLSGTSPLALNQTAPLLAQFEQKLQQAPWNIQVGQSWEENWMNQLQNGGATNSDTTGFEIIGSIQ